MSLPASPPPLPIIVDPPPPLQLPVIAGEAIATHHNSLGGDSGFLGPAVTPLEDDGGSGYHIDYKNGSIYWSYASGAHAIYGAIRAKWLSVGGVESVLGYPTTDEASTQDGVCRFNNFKNGGAIYWTAATGAHLVYGAIYQAWMSKGGESSSLGYPLTDETSGGNHGGRYNDFKGGWIFWSPVAGALVFEGAIPDHLDFHTNHTFPDGVAAGGWSQVTVFSNGNVQFSGHMHDSGAAEYDYSVACLLVDADNYGYSMGHTGKIAGTFESGSRDDDWNESTTNGLISQGWRPLMARASLHTDAQVNIDLGGLLNSVIAGVGAIAGVIAIF